MTDKTVEETVDELQAPETFDFLEVLNHRGYPTDEVVIYLDEATAHKISKLSERKALLFDESEMDAADAEMAALKAVLAKSAYTFKLKGVPGEVKEALAESAKEKFKPEYETSKNFITGQVQKFEKDNPGRTKFLGLSIFQSHVEQIVAPDGKVITAPEVGIIDAFLTKAPDAQVQKFIDAVNALQVSAQAFEDATDEDFLAKS